MATKTYKELLADIKKRKFAPLYLLNGDESYFIDKISDEIEQHSLQEFEKEFNLSIVYGKDCEATDIVNMAKRYPMMSEYQVVIVREAQTLKGLTSKSSAGDETEDGGKGTENNILLNYLTNPVPTTILVFCYKYKTIDKRSKTYKLIDKSGIVFESKRLYENAVSEWVTNYLKEKNYTIDPLANRLICEHLGLDLSRIANEINKLLINIPKETKITSDLIQTYIGISKEYNIFELINAIGYKDTEKAARIVNYFKMNPKSNPMVLSIANIGNYFSKLLTYHSLPNKADAATALKVNQFFMGVYETGARNFNWNKVVSNIGHIREYDLRSKGVNNNSVAEGDLLKELVFKLIH